MTEIRLKREFPAVKGDGKRYFGGAQAWSTHKYVRGYGCGVIACANVLLHTVDRMGSELDKDDYIKYARKLRRMFLPVIPKFGMNGIFMTLGVDLFFLFHRSPFIAYWGCLPCNIFKNIEKMLKDDIPVVLSAGPNWPNLFGKNTLDMYEKNENGYVKTDAMRAHYVTVTAMDDTYLTVSSWGKKYYVKRAEFIEYAKKHSNFIFSSIMVVRPLKKKYKG